MNEIYSTYYQNNQSKLLDLITNWLKNSKEGADVRHPAIRGVSQDGDKTYLRFERLPDETRYGNKFKILTTGSLIDFHYLGDIMKMFMYLDNQKEGEKWKHEFRYNNSTGKLEYLLNLIHQADKVKYKNGQEGYKGISGKHVQHVYKIKSPKGKYEPHNSKGMWNYGNQWNRYFNPEYVYYDQKSKKYKTAHNTSTGGGQFPVNWFPRQGNGVDADLQHLAKLVLGVISGCSDKTKALFIAFLQGVNSGSINGYQLWSNHQFSTIISQAEKIINPNQDRFSYSAINYDSLYNDKDDDEYYNHDEDMEYQVKHLGVESTIAQKVLKEFLNREFNI